jgi:hypothetical protein
VHGRLVGLLLGFVRAASGFDVDQRISILRLIDVPTIHDKAIPSPKHSVLAYIPVPMPLASAAKKDDRRVTEKKQNETHVV